MSAGNIPMTKITLELPKLVMVEIMELIRLLFGDVNTRSNYLFRVMFSNLTRRFDGRFNIILLRRSRLEICLEDGND